ncbi:DUF6461 domain-containing protein [Actinoplanes sp. NPDC023936]|uniref:DUF6461 domain-containing protein n=1 Tax=Actinoplanes sp. NPDC023936 TaxID=3154910 RepID=UPI0033E79154
MVAVSADDYAWFTEQFAELAGDHCLALIRGRTPAEVIAQVGGTNPTRAVGARRLTGSSVVAAAGVGDWTLLLQPDGRAAGRELSRGTVLVSHSATRFLWARDGEVVLQFDPADPSRRTGTDPDGLIEVLDSLGFDTTAAGDEPGTGWGDDARQRERGLALAEQLTGVRMTLESFEALTFTRATAPFPVDPGADPVPRPRTTGSPQSASRRPPVKPERWDEEYDAPAEEWSDADTDDEEEPDTEDREWPRLIARVRRAFT